MYIYQNLVSPLSYIVLLSPLSPFPSPLSSYLFSSILFSQLSMMVHIFLYFSLFFPLSDSDLTSWFESNFFGKICQNHHCCSPPIYPTSCYQFNLSCSDFACVKTEAPPTIETIIYFASKQRREKSSEILIYLFYRKRYLLGFWSSHEILQRTHGKFRFLFLCIFSY